MYKRRLQQDLLQVYIFLVLKYYTYTFIFISDYLGVPLEEYIAKLPVPVKVRFYYVLLYTFLILIILDALDFFLLYMLIHCNCNFFYSFKPFASENFFKHRNLQLLFSTRL